MFKCRWWLLLVLLVCAVAGVIFLLVCRREDVSWRYRGQVPLGLISLFNDDRIASAKFPAADDPTQAASAEPISGLALPSEELPESGSVCAVRGTKKTRFLFPGKHDRMLNNIACAGQHLGVPEGRYSRVCLLLAGGEAIATSIKLYYERDSESLPITAPSWKVDDGDRKPGLRCTHWYEFSDEGETSRRREAECGLWLCEVAVDSERGLQAIALPRDEKVHVFAVTLLAEGWTDEQAQWSHVAASSYASLARHGIPTYGGLAGMAQSLRERFAEDRPGLLRHFERQINWIETQLEYLHHVLPGSPDTMGAAAEAGISRMCCELFHRIAALRVGHDPFPGARGTLLKSYVSDVDGQPQPYFVSVPRRYRGQKAFPLIVHLHGHGWYAPFQGDGPPNVSFAIVLSPHGRGSQDYMYVAEDDVLRCIEEVKQDYRIDDDRVYLTGGSMGGTGSWNLGVKFPDVFAALAPSAGNADSKVWEQLWDWEGHDASSVAAVRRFVAYSIDPVTYAENLLNLPAFCVHGEEDDVVPVQHARSMVDRLQALGYRHEYVEIERGGHVSPPLDVVREQWGGMLAQRRATRPWQVRLKVSKLRYGKAYWVRIDQLARPLEYAEIEGSAEPTGEVEITTANVSAFSLVLDALPSEEATPLGVRVDGVEVFRGPRPDSPHLCFVRDRAGWRPGQPATGLAKRARLEGPIEDAFMSPFLIVYGTASADQTENDVAEAEARRFVNDWQRVFVKPCRIKSDAQVTEDDVQAYNLILYGGPSCNTITRRVANQLPIQIEQNAVSVGAHRFEGEDVGVKLCYPNPLNRERYVVVFAGVTWRGLFQIVNRFGNWFHWGPFDNRNWFDYGVFDGRTRSPETFLCFGFFDQQWRISAEHQWLGDEPARNAAPPRKLPRFTGPNDAALPATAPEGTSSQQCLYLSDLMPSEIDQHKGAVNFDRSFRGNPLRIGTREYAKGLGCRAPSRIEFDIGGRFDRFRAEVGVDLEGAQELTQARKENEWIRFKVLSDGKELRRSPWLQGDSPPHAIDIPIAGVQVLSLTVEASPARWHLGSAAWANARTARLKD